MRRSFTAILTVALATTIGAGALAGPAHAAMRGGVGSPIAVTTPPPAIAGPSPVVPSPPKYEVEAVKFKANDESGVDWVGSDEPYWIFTSDATPHTPEDTYPAKMSHTFSDVDTGETRTFSKSEGCIFSPDCSGAEAPEGIAASIQLWEADSNDASTVLAKTSTYMKYAFEASALTGQEFVALAAGAVAGVCHELSGWLQDDLLGSEAFTYSTATLASRLPTVGSSFTENRSFGGLSTSGGARYTLTLKVSRVG